MQDAGFNQTTAVPAGWHPDPQDPTQLRWWNGISWTDQVQPVPSPVPLEGPPVYPPYPSAQQSPVQSGQPRYQIRLYKVTSMLVLTQRRSAVYTGTYEQLEKLYKSVLLHNLLLGWWGFPFGLIWTPVSLSSNSGAWRKIRQMAGR